MRIPAARWMVAAISIALLSGIGVAQERRVPGRPDRTPDLSGMWRSTSNRYLMDLTAGSSPVVFQPWGRALYDERRAANGKGRPSERCLPRGVPAMMLARDEPWKIVQTAGVVIILF